MLSFWSVFALTVQICCALTIRLSWAIHFVCLRVIWCDGCEPFLCLSGSFDVCCLSCLEGDKKEGDKDGDRKSVKKEDQKEGSKDAKRDDKSPRDKPGDKKSDRPPRKDDKGWLVWWVMLATAHSSQFETGVSLSKKLKFVGLKGFWLFTVTWWFQWSCIISWQVTAECLTSTCSSTYLYLNAYLA